MLYRKNLGFKEDLAKMLGGALIAACSFMQIGISPLGLLLATSGIVTALTGALGFCPACAGTGRKSLSGST